VRPIGRTLAGLSVGALTAATLVATSGPAVATDTVHTVPGGSYRLHVPAGAAGALALVVNLPATYTSAAYAETSTGWLPVADAHGFAVLTPEPPPDARWNAGMCCVRPGEEAAHGDDTPYVLAAVADAATHVQVNPDRVYAAGFSGGAMKAWQLACDHPEVFAAAGVVAGTLATRRCGAAVAVLQLHGADDTAVPYDGGPGFESSLGRPPFPSAWASRLRCPRGSILPPPVIYPGVGHRWPSPDAAGRLWAFFAPLVRGAAVAIPVAVRSPK
jgi:poly(3-hydroxybutyrate) depolymerase